MDEYYFFESLYFNADIFLLDEDVFYEPFDKNLNEEIYCFNNCDKFKINLENYLVEGNFYKKDKKNSRNYFLNLGNLKNKAELFQETLLKIK